MKRFMRNMVVAVIFSVTAFATLLATAYGFILSTTMFGLAGGTVWLFLVIVIVLAIAATFLDEASTKADRWVNRP